MDILQLNDLRLASGFLQISVVSTNRYGAQYFHIHLKKDSWISQDPLLTGLIHSGLPPAYNWIEVVHLQRMLILEVLGIPALLHPCRSVLLVEITLFRYLSRLLPPGGHIMVEYESPEQAETRIGLHADIPPIATPIGYLLFKAGAASGLKNWHFAEGGCEGPRKLQGFKALDPGHQQLRSQETAYQLVGFLQQEAPAQHLTLFFRARQRTQEILRSLGFK